MDRPEKQAVLAGTSRSDIAEDIEVKKQVNKPIDGRLIIKATKKRYLILLMFIILCTLKSFQWVCLASITNIVAKYYNVDNIAVNWTTIVFMVTFIVLALPISWIMDQIGIRRSIFIGSSGTTIGVIIKCFSVYPGGFYLGMIGHLLVGFSEPFFFSIYSQLASVWFPDNQVALATSMGIMGEELGIALGFIIPSIMVGNDLDDDTAIQQGLFRLFVGVATVSVLNTISIALFFDDQPKNAPGVARFKQIEAKMLEKTTVRQETSFKEKLVEHVKELKQFFLDKNFNLLFIGFGINVGISYSIHTILNQMIAGPGTQWESANQVVGNAGLILIVAGAFGSVACGHVLDKWHQYKTTIILTYLFSLLSMVILSECLTLTNEYLPLYLAMVPLGFFLTGYSCCGFEYAVEITYPRPELVSSTLLNISAQIFGIPISLASSAIVDTYGNQAVGLFFSLILFFGLILTCWQKGELKRQDAVKGKEVPVWIH